jgi:hypothetical protein
MISHNTKSHTSAQVQFDFETNPSEVSVDNDTDISIHPLDSHNGRTVSLEKIHEKEMHLLVVSEDLSCFSHLHPIRVNDKYQINHQFPKAGKFHLFVDYSINGNQGVARHEILVKGKPEEPDSLPQESLIWKEAPYKLKLPEDQLPIFPQEMIGLTLLVYHNEVLITALDTYLGALAHVVIISEDVKQYLHVHPVETSQKGPEIKLHTSFPEAGKYKMFIQFKHKNKVMTASLVLNITNEISLL